MTIMEELVLDVDKIQTIVQHYHHQEADGNQNDNDDGKEFANIISSILNIPPDLQEIQTLRLFDAGGDSSVDYDSSTPNNNNNNNDPTNEKTYNDGIVCFSKQDMEMFQEFLIQHSSRITTTITTTPDNDEKEEKGVAPVVVHNLVVYMDAGKFDSKAAKCRFLTAILTTLHVTTELWMKTTGMARFRQEEDEMILELLHQLNTTTYCKKFRPKKVHVFDIGPRVLPGIQDYYSYHQQQRRRQHQTNNNIRSDIRNDCFLEILVIHLGCQFLPQGCYQRHEWTLEDVSKLSHIFSKQDNHHIATPLQVYLRIHQGALTVHPALSFSTTIVDDILLKCLPDTHVVLLALIGFVTPMKCGRLLITFLQQNHFVESFLPIWKPSGLSSGEKQTIQQLANINRDIKIFLRQLHSPVKIMIKKNTSQQNNTRHNDDIWNNDDDDKDNTTITDRGMLQPKHWSHFLAKVAALSPSKLYYLLREGEVLLQSQMVNQQY